MKTKGAGAGIGIALVIAAVLWALSKGTGNGGNGDNGVNFVYVSDIRLEPARFQGWNIYRWEIDVKNTGITAGECTVTFWIRMRSSRSGWGNWQIHSGKDLEWYITRTAIIEPGAIQTFSGYSTGTSTLFTFQRMITSEAGDILLPPEPLRYLCPICLKAMRPSTPPNFATKEELDEHITIVHRPEPTTRLFGYVTDKQTGAPVPFAIGTVYQDKGNETWSHGLLTNAVGYYEIDNMTPDAVLNQMVIYADGYETYTNEAFSIREGDNRRDIQMEPA